MATMDCTHNDRRRPLIRALSATAVARVLVLGGLAAQARADGDPASDVLATQTLFLPQDAGLTASQQGELAGQLAAAGHAGYRLRVAVVASPTDLGSVTALWHQPQTYAHFLAEELSSVYHGALLVVMPNGYGVHGVGGAAVPSSAGLGKPQLGTLGQAALPDEAISAGWRPPRATRCSVPTATTVASGGRATSSRGFRVRSPRRLILIAVAWTISLRARPMRVSSQPPASG